MESGYKIGDRIYPVATSFRLGDPLLIQELTELSWDEFRARIKAEEKRIEAWFTAEAEGVPEEEREDPPAEDPFVALGMIGVAVAQKNPAWPRAKVVEYVRNLEGDAVEFIAGEEPEKPEGDEERPPEEPAGVTTLRTSAKNSPSADTDSGETNQTSSGARPSALGSA
jgi:hypothetical protein